MGSYEITGEETEGNSKSGDKWRLCKTLLQAGGITGLTGLATYEIVTGDISDRSADIIGATYNPETIGYTYEIASSIGL